MYPLNIAYYNGFRGINLKIRNHTERIGVLTDIKEISDEEISLVFSIFEEIEIPKGAIPLDKLKSLIGKRIGVSRVDKNYSTRLAKRSKNSKKRK